MRQNRRARSFSPGWAPSPRRMSNQVKRDDPETERPPISRRPQFPAISNSGGGIRTRDLRVMSPTSYQTAPPRGGLTMIANLGPLRERSGTRGLGAPERELVTSLAQLWHRASTNAL